MDIGLHAPDLGERKSQGFTDTLSGLDQPKLRFKQQLREEFVYRTLHQNSGNMLSSWFSIVLFTVCCGAKCRMGLICCSSSKPLKCLTCLGSVLLPLLGRQLGGLIGRSPPSKEIVCATDLGVQSSWVM